MADWDKWDGQSWYRNNKNRPSGVGTVSHARREKMRQKALAREAAEALAKRDQNQAAADAAAPAAADAAAPAATNAAAPAATPSTTESSTSSSSSSSMHVDAKRAKTEPEQSLDKRDEKKDEEKDEKNDVKKEAASLDKRDEKKTNEQKKGPSLGKRDVTDGASSWRTPPTPPPPKPRPLVKRAETLDPVPEPEPEGTWILKQNKNTRVAVDWYNVMEVDDVVQHNSIAAVQTLLLSGCQVFMVCFCGPHRQHEVHQKLRQLPLEFTSVKYTRARTGATGKAAWLHKNSIGHLFDDNADICREALSKGLTVWPIRAGREKHGWADRAWDSLSSAVNTFLIEEALNS